MTTFDLLEPYLLQKNKNTPLTIVQFYRDIGHYDIENDSFNKNLFFLIRIRVLNSIIEKTSNVGNEFVFLYKWYMYYRNFFEKRNEI